MKVLLHFFLKLGLFCSFIFNVQGQNMSGISLDAKTNKPIPYVNIGLVGEDLGTVSNAEGQFTIDLKTAKPDDSLRFSCIGYHSRSIQIAQIRKAGMDSILFLNAKTYALETVEISSYALKNKVLGIPAKECYPIPLYKKAKTDLAFPQKNFSHEIGLFSKNSGLLVLDSLQVNFSEINIDSLYLRVNIYEKIDKHWENILSEALTMKVGQSDSDCSVRIDLTGLNLQVESDYLIALENHQQASPGAFKILVNTKKIGADYPTYYRSRPQSQWRILKSKSKDFGLSIQSYVRK